MPYLRVQICFLHIPQVRQLVAALTVKVQQCHEKLDAQAIGNALYGLQRLRDSAELRQLLTALTGQRHLGKVSVMVLRLLSDGNGRPRTKDVNGVLRLCNWELTRLVPASVQRPRSPGSPTAYATPTSRSVGLVHSGQFRLRVAFVFFTVKVRVS